MSRDGFYGKDQSEARKTGLDRVINVIEINVEQEVAFTIKLQSYKCNLLNLSRILHLHLIHTARCSEIGYLTSLDAPEMYASSDVREPFSLNQTLHLCTSKSFLYVSHVPAHPPTYTLFLSIHLL